MAPWIVPAVAAVAGGIFSGFGQSDANAKERAANKRRRRAARKQWNFQRDMVDAQNEYNMDVYETQIANAENARNFDYAQRMDEWRYGMGIRQYQYEQDMRMYYKSSEQRDQQMAFNQQALDAAYRQQDIYFDEKMLEFDFEGRQMEMSMRNQLSGYQDKQNSAGLQLRGQRAQAALEDEQNIVQGIIASGKARASGRTGRSAAKELQSTILQTEARSAAIAETAMQAGDAYNLTVAQITKQMNQAFDQYFLDKEALSASMASFKLADAATREQIALNKQQADMNAMAAVMLEPEFPPALPMPQMAPALEFTEPMELEMPPFDKSAFETGKQPDPFMTGLNTFVKNAPWSAIGGALA